MTAIAVEARTTTDERIKFVGKKVADLVKSQGLTWGMLAEDWGVSAATARNTAYWPSSRSVPPAERVEALEKAVGLPVGTLLEQYYVERIDPAYWGGEAESAKAPAKAAGPKKTAALSVKTATPAKKPVIEVEPVSEYDETSKLRRRIGHLERCLVALAPLVAKGAGVDEDRLLAALRLGS